VACSSTTTGKLREDTEIQISELYGQRPRSWLKGIVTNLLNPHPWVFWPTMGSAMLAKTMAQGWLVALVFDLPPQLGIGARPVQVLSPLRLGLQSLSRKTQSG